MCVAHLAVESVTNERGGLVFGVRVVTWPSLNGENDAYVVLSVVDAKSCGANICAH